MLILSKKFLEVQQFQSENSINTGMSQETTHSKKSIYQFVKLLKYLNKTSKIQTFNV